MSELKENDFPPLEPQPFVTEEGQEIERLRADEERLRAVALAAKLAEYERRFGALTAD